MCDSKVLYLKFIGMDSWDRPVYKDDLGTLWKDVVPRAGMKPDLCTSYFPLQEFQRPADLIPGRTPAASVHFPDFLLCVISEKVKEYDFPKVNPFVKTLFFKN